MLLWRDLSSVRHLSVCRKTVFGRSKIIYLLWWGIDVGLECNGYVASHLGLGSEGKSDINHKEILEIEAHLWVGVGHGKR